MIFFDKEAMISMLIQHNTHSSNKSIDGNKIQSTKSKKKHNNVEQNEFNEVDLNRLRGKLDNIEKELNRPSNVSIREQSTSFINNISLTLPSEKGKYICLLFESCYKSRFHLHLDIRWKQSAITVAEGFGRNDQLDQLDYSGRICLDDRNQLIYITDTANHRVVEWGLNANNGRIAAGGNGQGNRLDQLNHPLDVIIDRQNNDLIVADSENRRVMRWSRQSNSPPQIIIDNIDCFCPTIHADGTLYVSDYKKHRVGRWKKGEILGTIVAGGNGEGNRFNQLNCATHLFVDDDHNLYISDFGNDRVMKWMKDTKEGTVVAGGKGRGNQLTQSSRPLGVIVDQYGQIYVADWLNNRVMRWCEEEKEGRIVVGGNDKGKLANQFNGPTGLSFDGEGNLYVVDWGNHRIQKFERKVEEERLVLLLELNS